VRSCARWRITRRQGLTVSSGVSAIVCCYDAVVIAARNRIIVSVVLLSLALTIGSAQSRPNALSPDVVSTLSRAETFELLSLSGEQDAKGWHGYRLLGKTAVGAADVRARLLTALESGIAKSTGPGARCFVPRHGIHAVSGDKTVDLLICFECSWVRVFTGGAETTAAVVTTTAPQPVFDQVLQAAKVPRAQ
jgi:hypothetical protein